MKIVKGIMIVAVAIATFSCIVPQNSVMVAVDLPKWSEAKSIVYKNSNTSAQHDLNIAIRYNDNFKETMLPLKIAIVAPDKRMFEDTVSLQLKRPATALTVSTTESRPYRTNIILDQEGEYIFAFKPLTELRGVEAIGIELK